MAKKSKKKNTKRNVPQKKVKKKKFEFKRRKKEKSAEELKKMKLFRRVFLIVLAVVLVLTAVPTVTNVVFRKIHRSNTENLIPVDVQYQLTPARDTGGSWTFITNRDFKIMQLSDIEIGGGFLSTMEDSSAFLAVRGMVEEERPDLLIITGDLVNSSLLKAGSANNMAAFKILAELIDDMEVYWTVTLGEEDAKGFATKEKIAEYLASEELEYCLFELGDESVDGYGNNQIKVKNIDGEIIQTIYTFDTHGNKDESITSSQIEWYKKSVADSEKENEKYNKDNKNKINSLAFMHKPLEEYKLAYDAYSSKNTKEIEYHYGEAGESVHCSPKSDELFETMLEIGSTKGIFCGHDHLNTFSMDYKGITLTYCGSVDYLDYKDIDTYGKQRNCTIIDIDLEDKTFECKSENYYQNKYPSEFEKEDMRDLNIK